jgi:SAM-dependent methyltransferase
MDLKEQEALGESASRHWYYRAKSAAMLRLLAGTAFDEVLDVGAGSGFFARYLLANTACRSATCVDPNYPREWRETECGKPIAFVHHVDNFAGNLALMMDVLEHVPDDVGLLRDYAAKLQPGSRILITVPAMPWMWSRHDVFLEHYRRYTLHSLEKVIAAAGLKRISTCYYFGLTLPMAAGLRLGRRALFWRKQAPGSDMRPQGNVTNAALLGISRLELGLFRANRIAGLSAFALIEV